MSVPFHSQSRDDLLPVDNCPSCMRALELDFIDHASQPTDTKKLDCPIRIVTADHPNVSLVTILWEVYRKDATLLSETTLKVDDVTFPRWYIFILTQTGHSIGNTFSGGDE